MLPSIFTLLLCFQWVAADDARLDRQPKAATAASPHVLSQLLVKPSPKFALRDTGDSCGTGWRELCFFFPRFSAPTDTGIYQDICPNFSDDCAQDGYYCVCLFMTR